MQELIQKIAKEADISEEKAKIAAEAAVAFIKTRVAYSIDTKVKKAVENLTWTIQTEVHEAVTGEPVPTFSEKMGDFAENAKEKMEDFAENAQEKFGEFTKNAGSFFSGFGKKEKDEDNEEKGRNEDATK